MQRWETAKDLWMVVHDHNATPWEPLVLMEQAKKEVKAAGGKIVDELVYTVGFVFQCESNPIDPANEFYKNRITARNDAVERRVVEGSVVES